jgi:hypothetical protein
MHRLSAKTIEKAKEPGYYCDGGGLYLQISPTISKSWIFRYKRHGKSHWMGLGSERDVSLAEARTKAADARRQLVDGKDPLAAREGHRAQEKLQKASSIPFAECAKKYIDAHKAGWKNGKHAEQWQSTLDTYAGPVIGELPVRDVDTALVLRILEPIWSKKPETASRLRGRIERILDYARVRGYRSGENPALWRGHLDAGVGVHARRDAVADGGCGAAAALRRKNIGIPMNRPGSIQGYKDFPVAATAAFLTIEERTASL